LDFILRNQGVELFEAIQVFPLGCAVDDATHSTKIHRFQLRIVVDVDNAKLLSSISLSYRKFRSFFWFHQDTKQFSQGNGNLLPLLQRH
jgi:hypothetical protein